MKSVEDVRAYMSQAEQKARANKRATREALQAELAAIWFRSQTTASQLQHSSRGTTDTERRRLLRKLIGSDGQPSTGSDAVSRRDAADRAAALEDPTEAIRLLRVARDTGDDHLMQAIVRHGLERAPLSPQWGNVVEEYTGGNETAAQTYRELQALPNYQNQQTAFRDTIAHVMPKPAEIAKLSDQQIRQLAASELAGDERLNDDGSE